MNNFTSFLYGNNLNITIIFPIKCSSYIYKYTIFVCIGITMSFIPVFLFTIFGLSVSKLSSRSNFYCHITDN